MWWKYEKVIMKPGTPKKAPKVAAPSRKNPNFMREMDAKSKKTSPMAPMTKKSLSK